MRRCRGAVELVDASEMLPDLQRRPGWRTWKVLDDDLNEWATYAETQDKSVPAPKRRLFVPSMWPSTARGQEPDKGEQRGGDADQGLKTKGKKRRVKKEKFPLERCVRLFPHLQDTGSCTSCTGCAMRVEGVVRLWFGAGAERLGKGEVRFTLDGGE